MQIAEISHLPTAKVWNWLKTSDIAVKSKAILQTHAEPSGNFFLSLQNLVFPSDLPSKY